MKAKNYCEEKEKRKRKRRRGRRRRKRGGREEEEKKKKRKKKGLLDEISYQRDLMKIAYHKTTEDLFEFFEEDRRDSKFAFLHFAKLSFFTENLIKETREIYDDNFYSQNLNFLYSRWN